MQNRLMEGNRCVYDGNRLLKSKLISKSRKIKMYVTVVRPIMSFANEVLTLGKREQATYVGSVGKESASKDL